MIEPLESFQTILENDDLLVEHHQLHGISLMPGMSAFELVLRTAMGCGFELENFTIKNFTLLSPLTTTNEFDRELKIDVYQKDDFYEIQIFSQKVREEEALEKHWVTNVTCELIQEENKKPNDDLEILKLETFQKFDIEDLYEIGEKVGLSHKEFLRAEGNYYITNEFLVLKLNASDFSKEYGEEYVFQPSIFDASAMGATLQNKEMWLSGKVTEPYIPLFIGEAKIFQEPSEVIYVRIPLFDVSVLENDTHSYDYELFDDVGKCIGYFKKFLGKKVRFKELITQMDVSIHPEKIDPSHDDVPLNEDVLDDHLVEFGNDKHQMIAYELKNEIAKLLKKSPDEIKYQTIFFDLGLESMEMMQFSGTLTEKIQGGELYPTLMFEYPTIYSLSQYFSENNFEWVLENV